MPEKKSKFFAVTIDGRKHIEVPHELEDIEYVVETIKDNTYFQNNRVFAIIEESTIRYTYPDDFENEKEDRGDGYDYY